MSRREEARDEPDIQVGAAARMRRLRFRRKPKTKTEAHGHARMREGERVDDVELESRSEGRRRNLPDEVEPGVTYRDVEVGWVAEARTVARKPKRDSR